MQKRPTAHGVAFSGPPCKAAPRVLTITEEGLRNNVSVGIQYLASWLQGNGCVPINHLMEHDATAEISRTQVWQWLHHPQGIPAEDRRVTEQLLRQVMAEERDTLRGGIGAAAFEAGIYARAAELCAEIITRDKWDAFLTLRAYDLFD